MPKPSNANILRSLTALAILSLSTASHGANGLRVLMASGDNALYVGVGPHTMFLIDGSFNAQGQLAALITVPITGGSSQFERMVVATGADGLFRVVARESTQLPGAPAGDLRFPQSPPLINAKGQVTFSAQIYPSGYPNSANNGYYDTLWSETGGMHAVDTRLSEPSHWRYIHLKGFADNGNVLYYRGGSRENGSSPISDDPELLIEENGSSRHLFKRNNLPPVHSCGIGFCSVRQDYLFGSSLAPDGSAIYGMQVVGSGITTLNNDFILRSTPTATTSIVRDGDLAWGLPDGYRFSHVLAPEISFNGQLVFQSFLDTPSGTELHGSVFANTGGAPRMLARYGTPAPGFGGTKTFVDFPLAYPTETGRPVVLANLSGSEYKTALYREVAGQLSLVMQSNQPAPGIPNMLLAGSNPTLNESPTTGATFLSDSWYNTEPSSGVGLWRIDQGNWQLLLSSGQPFDVKPGDVRTISWLRTHPFTANGMLPIHLTFTDGTDALVAWTDAAPPIPGDANGDYKVDAADYIVWRNGLGQSVLGGYGADFDGDRTVTMADYQLWRSNYGRLVPGSPRFEVPEPTPLAATLCLITKLMVLRCGNRRGRTRVSGPRALP